MTSEDGLEILNILRESLFDVGLQSVDSDIINSSEKIQKPPQQLLSYVELLTDIINSSSSGHMADIEKSYCSTFEIDDIS